ncbi:MAG: hypothetical protein JXQ72_13970 [Anaerolineae bacterium]|nr:hypothetical protein [Anaerolineae bacterium]
MLLSQLKQRWHQPEIWLFRLGFAALGVFLALCGVVITEPSDLAMDALGYWLLITQGIAVLSGLVTIYTPR